MDQLTSGPNLYPWIIDHLTLSPLLNTMTDARKNITFPCYVCSSVMTKLRETLSKGILTRPKPFFTVSQVIDTCTVRTTRLSESGSKTHLQDEDT